MRRTAILLAALSVTLPLAAGSRASAAPHGRLDALSSVRRIAVGTYPSGAPARLDLILDSNDTTGENDIAWREPAVGGGQQARLCSVPAKATGCTRTLTVPLDTGADRGDPISDMRFGGLGLLWARHEPDGSIDLASRPVRAVAAGTTPVPASTYGAAGHFPAGTGFGTAIVDSYGGTGMVAFTGSDLRFVRLDGKTGLPTLHFPAPIVAVATGDDTETTSDLDTFVLAGNRVYTVYAGQGVQTSRPCVGTRLVTIGGQSDCSTDGGNPIVASDTQGDSADSAIVELRQGRRGLTVDTFEGGQYGGGLDVSGAPLAPATLALPVPRVHIRKTDSSLGLVALYVVALPGGRRQVQLATAAV